MSSWIVFALLSAFFASLVAIFGKVGISKIDTTLATTIRAIIMTLFLFSVTLISGKFKVNSIGQSAFFYIVLSGIAGALSWLCYFIALKLGSASAVAALDRLSVVFVVVLSLIFLGEKVTPFTLLGITLITTGAILLVVK
jgi:transporter family protein